MANPSLQIGNDNWAVKEDNLLGYSTAGTRFVPEPITMTRTSAGTRVNPSGLVEDVELLGDEEVINGDFATDSSWVKQDGWTISGGQAHFSFTGTGNRNLYQSPTTSGKLYKLTFEITSLTQGRIRNVSTSVSDDTFFDTVGVHTQYYTSTGTTLYLKATPDAILSIDNVSVKEATKNDLARVDYTDGTSSLLVEPQRTNLLTYSEDFSDSSWLRAGSITTTDNYTTSPSGQNNATRLQWTNATNFIYQNVSHVGSDFTLSIYLKSNTGVSQNVRLFMDNGAQATNVVVTTQWQRFEFTSTSTPTQSNRNTGLIKSSSQVGNLDISIWSAQFEEGSYPTSYIPTSGSTVTRNQEAYTKTGVSDLINSTEGTLVIEPRYFINDGSTRKISISDGTGTNRIYITPYQGLASRIRYIFTNGGATQADLQVTGIDITVSRKLAFVWKANRFELWQNGSKISEDTSGTTPSAGTFNQIHFGSETGNGTTLFEGELKQLQIFKTALSDSELATLTT